MQNKWRFLSTNLLNHSPFSNEIMNISYLPNQLNSPTKAKIQVLFLEGQKTTDLIERESVGAEPCTLAFITLDRRRHTRDCDISRNN